MKVITSDDNILIFDNGLEVIGEGHEDCCAYNYIDFEQFPAGTELKDMNVKEFVEAMELKEDGFSIKDKEGTPKWAQARSDQNGYYSDLTDLVVKREGEEEVRFNDLEGEL